ncbi:hypothetical protein CPB86DRAFT_819428 [Serendipita vermifera]|nr:hypothetical protein CPB86DRAFT_819428 [Serendipita vermifera]
MDKTEAIDLEEWQIKAHDRFQSFEKIDQVVQFTRAEANRGQCYESFALGAHRGQSLTIKGLFSIGVEIISLITAIIFGMWAIRSYDAATKANAMTEEGLRQNALALQQSLIANQLPLLALCGSNDEFGDTAICRGAKDTIDTQTIAYVLGIDDIPSQSPPFPVPPPPTTVPSSSFATTTSLPSGDGIHANNHSITSTVLSSSSLSSVSLPYMSVAWIGSPDPASHATGSATSSLPLRTDLNTTSSDTSSTTASATSSATSSVPRAMPLDPVKILFSISMGITGFLAIAILSSAFLAWRRSRCQVH